VRLKFETVFLVVVWVAVILVILLFPHFTTG
jgi:hypothetical protein